VGYLVIGVFGLARYLDQDKTPRSTAVPTLGLAARLPQSGDLVRRLELSRPGLLVRADDQSQVGGRRNRLASRLALFTAGVSRRRGRGYAGRLNLHSWCGWANVPSSPDPNSISASSRSRGGPSVCPGVSLPLVANPGPVDDLPTRPQAQSPAMRWPVATAGRR